MHGAFTSPASMPTPVIVGPTAGGKSALAVAVAQLAVERLGLGAEVITADAFQVYRGMDIGTAKPGLAERAGLPHHLIDLREPTERFSVAEWLGLARACERDVRARGRLPIVVGGTHLFVKAYLDGLFEGPDPDPAIRAVVRAMTQAERRAELARIDPEAAGRIHANDERRTARALEVYRQTGVPISAQQTQWDRERAEQAGDGPSTLLIGLDWPTDAINRRINARVRAMVAAGLVDEVAGLVRAGRLGPQAGEALGYKQIAAAMSADGGIGAAALAEAIERIKIETRRFAKNQRTWLKRLRLTPGSLWLTAAAEASEPRADVLIVRWADAVVAALGGALATPVSEREAMTSDQFEPPVDSPDDAAAAG